MATVMAECLRICQPGAHALVWALPRTSHWSATAMEDAGWEIRDVIVHLFGQGFPKSLSVSKAIEAGANAEETRRWDGWGTGLKPASEHWIVARKPFKGSVASNVQEHGTGALNIDRCRIPTTDLLGGGWETGVSTERMHEGWRRPWMDDAEAVEARTARTRHNVKHAEALGRWPANVVLDETAATLLDEQSGSLTSGANPTRRSSAKTRNVFARFDDQEHCTPARGVDRGGASRFFYTAKASQAERGEGNDHPTVKALALMRWLVRLVTPSGGTVLDPFAGSGSTLVAALQEGFNAIGIEQEAEYVSLIHKRLDAITLPLPLYAGQEEAS